VRNSIKALCIAGMSLALASPAFGAAKIYSSIRYDTFYINQKGPDNIVNSAGDDSATTLQNTVAGNSRVGIKFTEGKLSGQWEMGLPGSNTRLAWAKYSFNDASSVLVGQTYNPWTVFSDQVYGADNGMIGFGALYDGRQPQVKFTFNGMYLTFVDNHNLAVAGGGVELADGTVVKDTIYNQIPKMAIGYDGKAGPASFGAGFAYQTYKQKNIVDGFDVDVDTYLAYAHASVKFGMVTVKGSAHYGQNLAVFGISGRSASVPVLQPDLSLDDTDSYGGFVEVSAAMTPTVGMNAGVGFTRDELGNTDYDQTTVFVNFPLEIAPGFHIVPEFDYFHYSQPTVTGLVPNVGLPTEDAYVVGAKWQVDF